MLSNKQIICPVNLLNASLKNKGASAAIVNAGKPLPMQSVMDAVKENLIKPIFIGSNYIKRIKDNIKIIKKLTKIKGVKEINFPGEGTKKRYKKNMKKNIPIPKSIMEDLKKLNAI